MKKNLVLQLLLTVVVHLEKVQEVDILLRLLVLVFYHQENFIDIWHLKLFKTNINTIKGP